MRTVRQHNAPPAHGRLLQLTRHSETATAMRGRGNHQVQSLTWTIEGQRTPIWYNGGVEIKQQRRQCSVLGCGRMGRNKGTVNGATRYDHKCENHHRTKVRLEASSMFFRKHIKNATCETCGWSQSYCDRHRIVPTVGYTRDNVKILCPNCHRLEHEAGKPRLNL